MNYLHDNEKENTLLSLYGTVFSPEYIIKQENHFLSSLHMSPTSRLAILTCTCVCQTPYYPLGK